MLKLPNINNSKPGERKKGTYKGITTIYFKIAFIHVYVLKIIWKGENIYKLHPKCDNLQATLQQQYWEEILKLMEENCQTPIFFQVVDYHLIFENSTDPLNHWIQILARKRNLFDIQF